MTSTNLQVPALDNDEYTVGWITALALEAAAAEAMLEVEHEEPHWQHENDHNNYTLGSIGKHNVVIVSLPETYGPTAAATAVSQMLSTFKSIRIGLMVGIGGGIPNLENGHDIRLGDIVVSRPEGAFGGVRQYDFGKMTSGGNFLPQGFLNSPPQVLLDAVNKLKRNHIRKPSDIPNILREMEKNNPLMIEPLHGGPSYSHQGPENDFLFHSNYNHKDAAKTCEECDKGQVVERPLRKTHDPFIHHGTIASGNMVIKDRGTRDGLGSDCLCFEMEAAAQHNQELLKWLSPLEPSERHDDIRSTRLPRSGTWILQHETFQKWFSESPSSPVLFCYGDPGAGKTFITSLIIDELERFKATKSNIGLAYVYCDYRDQIQQTIENIIGAIIKQLLRELPAIPEEIIEIWQKKQSGTSHLQLELKEVLHITCKYFDHIYICLDALDECRDFPELLTILYQGPPSIRLFSTGRNHVQQLVRKKIEHARIIRIEAKDSDIRMLIQEDINKDREQDPDLMDDKLEQDIIEKISASAHGIFLLPVLHVRTVLDERNVRDREDALKTLPSDLDQAFGVTIERIQRQPTGAVKQAEKVLRWISLAERPLSIDELLEACAVRDGDSDLNKRGFPSRSTFLDCCLGLAIIENETSTVRLVHFSLQEYFNRKKQILNQPILDHHDAIARACLTYLMFRSVTAEMDTSQRIKRIKTTQIASHALLNYAACQWGHHIRKCGCLQNSTINAALEYLRMDSEKRMRSHSLLCRYIRISKDYNLFSIIHIWAYFGINQISLKLLVTNKVDVDTSDNEGRTRCCGFYSTALSTASAGGHEAVVKLLLEKGADINAQGGV
ncbi:hypothetical protein G7Y89_g2285 [Cudoniella acicularis]|uniref:Uncharacterized protein n=1 Tax=Cudoniella acicularis TaxID=354080 RepID=A0A8H4W9H9_9HELO|nr:hypothetical protein G7Y89_g2285 [Cudoniella acicularis]